MSFPTHLATRRAVARGVLPLLAAVALVPAGCSAAIARTGIPRTVAAQLLDFVAANPERASLHVVHEDSIVASFNADRAQPLASTAKVIIAVEYAVQAASGAVSPDERVPLTELERLHLPGTDGGAHAAWTADVRARRLARDGSVTLLEVARGMIRFSSNANADHLARRLGYDRVNARPAALGIAPHGAIIPYAGSMLLLRSRTGETEAAALARLRAIPAAEWAARAREMDGLLRADTSGALRRAFRDADLSLARQRIWSDRLPSSTARQYAALAHALNARTALSPESQRHLDSVLDVPKRAAELEHLGVKGGSTGFVLTEMVYARRVDGTRTEYAILIDGLTPKEVARLRRQLELFRYVTLTNADFREDLKALR